MIFKLNYPLILLALAVFPVLTYKEKYSSYRHKILLSFKIIKTDYENF
ncbi:hypothetical protein PMI10_03519 [Flavobacterium sp. CF136]|nr:hypothetical protein PMI10_03519 [Flavobacterium sp. CF136]